MVVEKGFKPLTHSLAYHTCFYTSQLKHSSDTTHPLYIKGGFSLSRCSLDHFFTILKILQVRYKPVLYNGVFTCFLLTVL